MAIDLSSQIIIRVFDLDYRPLGRIKVAGNDPKFTYQINKLISGFNMNFNINEASSSIETSSYVTEGGEPLVTEDGEQLLAEIPSGVFLGENGLLDVGYNLEFDFVHRSSTLGGTVDDIIRTESNQEITDEADDPLYQEIRGRRPQATMGGQQLRTIFKGYVSKYKIKLDGSGISGFVKSHSQGLNDIKLQNPDPEIVDVSDSNDGTNTNRISISESATTAVAQAFVVNTAARLDYIRVMMSIDSSLGARRGINTKIYLFRGALPNNIAAATPVAVAFAYHIVTPSPADYFMHFETSVPLIAGTYHLVIETDSIYDFYIYRSSNNPYGSNAITINGNNRSTLNRNLRLVLFGRDFSTTVTYANMKPSDMFKKVLDFAKSQGVLIDYNSASIEDSGPETYTRTFKNTIPLKALEKIRELAGADFYYYCDFGTGIVYFQRYSITVNRQLAYDHYSDMGGIEKNGEKIVNEVYFVGGKLSDGSALYVVVQSNKPVKRRRVDEIRGNRVTDVATAKAIARAHLEANEDAIRSGDIEIIRNEDFLIEDVKPGELLALAGVSAEVDSESIRLVRFTYTGHSLRGKLGYVPPRITEQNQITQVEVNEIADIDVPDRATT